MNQTHSSFSLADVLAAVQAAGLFISNGTVQAPAQTLNGIGQVDLSTWANVAGLTGIGCMRAPEGLMSSRFRSTEYKTANETAEMTPFHILLNGYYPAIMQRYRFVCDGEPLDIIGIEHDSQHTMTRLLCRSYSL